MTASQFDRRFRIVQFYSQRVVDISTKSTETDAQLWMIGDELIGDAFSALQNGCLDDAHEICLWGLQNDVIELSAYHAGCAHAILSTSPIDTQEHASRAYGSMAKDFSFGTTNFKAWSVTFGYLSQAAWGLSTFMAKRQWESMMADHLKMEQDKDKSRLQVERLLHEKAMQKAAPEDAVVDVRSLRSYRSLPKPNAQLSPALALAQSERRLAPVQEVQQEQNDHTTSPQAPLEQEGTTHNTISTDFPADRSPGCQIELPWDVDGNAAPQQSNNALNRAVPPYDTRFYEDDDFEYHIEDIQEYNRQVAAARLVDLHKLVSKNTTSFSLDNELEEATVSISTTRRRSSHGNSQHTSPVLTEAYRSVVARDDAQDLHRSSREEAGGCSSHLEEPAAGSPAPNPVKAESLGMVNDDCGRKTIPEDDSRSDSAPLSDMDLDECCRTPPDSMAEINEQSPSPPPEDHTASDYQSVNSEMDSDLESEVWDAMYNDRYLAQARDRVAGHISKITATKGQPPEIFDQIICFLRSLRILWQTSQPDCRHMIIDSRLKKLWVAQHIIRCKGLVG